MHFNTPLKESPQETNGPSTNRKLESNINLATVAGRCVTTKGTDEPLPLVTEVVVDEDVVRGLVNADAAGPARIPALNALGTFITPTPTKGGLTSVINDVATTPDKGGVTSVINDVANTPDKGGVTTVIIDVVDMSSVEDGSNFTRVEDVRKLRELNGCVNWDEIEAEFA